MASYVVTFAWYDTGTYCTNIAEAEDVETVEAEYKGKYKNFVSVRPASPDDLEEAVRKGMPFHVCGKER